MIKKGRAAFNSLSRHEVSPEDQKKPPLIIVYSMNLVSTVREYEHTSEPIRPDEPETRIFHENLRVFSSLLEIF